MIQFFNSVPDLNAGVELWRQSHGGVLLDVRTRAEYLSGHVPGSINLPLEQLHTIQISKNVPLFVYCRSGRRSQEAADWLTANGYKATNVGGIIEYDGTLE
ncbi:rhodanese-like domain-containing protein [uncultured Allofournierella sp.]|uniref:rhodanese-like domain-containing protein n=1 Tax=uncultured Allofournierella sp. TaxID=1940258 RepID=UPI0037517988